MNFANIIIVCYARLDIANSQLQFRAVNI